LFTQADRTLHRSEGGLGVGLTVVQRVVQLHGGTVEANSAGLNQGAEFIVRLPVSSPKPCDTPEVDRESAAGRRRLRVVVVDDNRDSADTIAMLLTGSGRDVRVEYTGPAGLETVRSFRPDAVLLDIGLPGLDGYEVARAIRRDPELSGVQLIAVSGYGQESDRRRSKDAGFDVHMVKPVEPQTIEDVLNAVPGF
jgi:two-component system CheB/CheR fusion protein